MLLCNDIIGEDIFARLPALDPPAGVSPATVVGSEVHEGAVLNNDILQRALSGTLEPDQRDAWITQAQEIVAALFVE